MESQVTKNIEFTRSTAEKTPECWSVVALGDVCKEVVKKDRNKKIVPEDRHKLLTVKLYSKGIIWRNLADTKKFKPSKLLQVKENDFIYSKIDARNGAWGIIKKEFEGGLVSGDFPILEVAFEKVSKVYFQLLMGREEMWLPLKDISSGTTGRRRVNSKEFLRLIKFELPPLAEQKAIARVLTTVQDAITGQQELITKLKELKRSMMQQLFTRGTKGEKTKMTEIGEVPESWEVVALGDVCDVLASSITFKQAEIKFGTINVHGIKVSDMNIVGNEKHIFATNTNFNFSNTDKLIPSGAIIFPKRGAAIATNKKRITSNYSLLDPNLIAVIPKSSILSDFLFYYFERFDLSSLTDPGTIPQLNKKDLTPVLLPLPEKKEQQFIVIALNSVDIKITTNTEQLSVYKNLFKTLLHELMGGERRVRHE